MLLRILLAGMLALELTIELDVPVAHVLSVDKRAANKIAWKHYFLRKFVRIKSLFNVIDFKDLIRSKQLELHRSELNWISNRIHNMFGEKVKYLPSFEDLQKFLQLVHPDIILNNFASFLEDQMHDIVYVKLETFDVVSLNMLKDWVHDIKVFDLTIRGLKLINGSVMRKI